jgi:hypothetical protein
MNKNYAEVNTSYTVFFILFLLGLSLFFGNLLPETKNLAIIVLILYGLLFYFILDFIKQLYSPGQAVFLYFMTFTILPFAMNWLLDYPFARLGTIIVLGAYFLSGIFEVLYEGLVKKRLPRNLSKRIVLMDSKIDTRMISLSNKYVYLSDFNGIALALVLMTTYFVLSYILFHR